MKVNLEKELTNRFGKVMTEEQEVITVRHVIYTVLDNILEDDHKMSMSDKLKLAKIGQKVVSSSLEMDMSSADSVLLLERASKFLNTNLYGQLVMCIDPTQME